MSRERISNGNAVMRHLDGSIDFGAYRTAARRERQAAIVSSIEAAARATRALLASFGAVLADRPVKQQPHHAK